MDDWRDGFNRKWAYWVRYQQFKGRYVLAEDADCTALLKMLEAVRDHGHVSGRDYRKLEIATLTEEHLHWAASAVASLPPGPLRPPSEWTDADRVRFASGA